MEPQGWTAAAQAVIVAIATWYIRRGGKKDREDVKRTTVAVASNQTCELGDRMIAVENGLSEVRQDVGLMKILVSRDSGKSITLKENRNGI